MKAQLKRWPAWLKVLVYFFLLGMATLIAGTIPVLNDFIFFFLVSLTVSWVFMHAEKEPILSLGFVPRLKKDFRQFFGGLGIGMLMLLFTVAITLSLTQDQWHFNPHLDLIYVAIAFFTCLLSAFVQEFVFRGYPFQVLLKSYRPFVAQIAIAIPFGMMHLHGNMSATAIATVMLTTGLGSILFGLAYLRTGKLFLSIGLHLGWNYAQQLVPRTAGGGHSGLIIIPAEQTNYTNLIIIGPYLIVVVVAIIGLAMLMPKRNKL